MSDMSISKCDKCGCNDHIKNDREDVRTFLVRLYGSRYTALNLCEKCRKALMVKLIRMSPYSC